MNTDDADSPELSADELELLRHLDAQLGPDPYLEERTPQPSVIEAGSPDGSPPTPVLVAALMVAVVLLVTGLLALSPVAVIAGAALWVLSARRLRRARTGPAPTDDR